MNEKWSSLTIEDIEKKLRTNAATGLSPKAARSRCDRKEQPFFTVKRRRWDMLLLDLFRDFFLVMLVMVAFFSLFFEGDYVIGCAMLLLIVVNIAFSFLIYYRDRRALESMSEFFSPTARVIRGGKLYIADYKDVVVGDVIIVEKGDILGCDARLIYSNDLFVKMRVDRQTEKTLQKYAGAAVAENELHAENMANMIHAGSIVEKGSGRALVVATGKYTYYGAMEGSFVQTPSSVLPEGLASLKKRTSKLGILLLLLTLPFCIFGLLFGHFTGGTVVLSEVLAVALAIGASCMLSRFSDVFLTFFVRFVRGAALSENPCIIRSVSAFDRAADMDYLFVLDGSIATDGILHFEALTTADGEARGFDAMGQSAMMLCDMIALYDTVRKSSPTAGIEVDSEYDIGIGEFIQRSRIDINALRIRCPVLSFLPKAHGQRDTLVYTDMGERREMTVAFSSDVIEECDSALFAGVPKSLSEEGKDAIKKTYERAVAFGRKPIVFTLFDGTTRCYVGMLVLKEGVDVNAERSVAMLKKSGVNVIMFSNCIGRKNAPEIPDTLRGKKRVASGDFFKRGLPVTHDFGEFDEYCYLDENMIAELAKHVKSQNKTLALLGFSDYAHEAMAQADIFISCTPIKTDITGHLDEEIKVLEIPGEQSSASCTQIVKSKADVLLMRPKDGRGGLEPLSRIIECGKIAYRNFKNFIVYLVCVQMMRIITVVFPMLLGNTTADARHIVFLGFILDFMTMLLFAADTRRAKTSARKMKKAFSECSLVDIARSDIKLFVSAIVGSVLTLLLPNVLGLVDVFGNYLYQAEFTYMSLVLMQILAVFCIYSGDLADMGAHKRLVSSYMAIAQGCVVLLFTALCLIIRPLGNFFGIVKNPLAYFLLSFVPALAFGVCYVLMSITKKQEMKKNM